MEIKEMTSEQIEARISEISAELNTADEMTKIEELRKEFDALKERKSELLDAAAKRQALLDDIANDKTAKVIDVIDLLEKREENKMENVEVRNTKEYIDAYAEFVKSEDDTECRALLSENGTDGTIPVPELVYDVVKTAWDREGITARVRKSFIKGNLKVGFEISATGAVQHEEGVAVNEETLVLGTVQLIPKSIKKWISISDEALDLRGEAFLRYIYDELTYQIAKKAADLVVAGIEAAGTQSTATAVGVPVVTAATISLGTIASAIGALSDEAANPVIMMNKATWASFKAVQAAGNYGYDPFEGLPVVFNNTIKAFSAASTGDTYAIVGDLGHGALMNFPAGQEISFKVDDNTLATSDLVRIIGREFVGIGIVAPNAFVKVQK